MKTKNMTLEVWMARSKINELQGMYLVLTMKSAVHCNPIAKLLKMRKSGEILSSRTYILVAVQQVWKVQQMVEDLDRSLEHNFRHSWCLTSSRLTCKKVHG